MKRLILKLCLLSAFAAVYANAGVLVEDGGDGGGKGSTCTAGNGASCTCEPGVKCTANATSCSCG
jgi:hypothetical protein